MELRHLRYFVTLADELHFGRAARRLGISQPPLSQQIKALEDGLGARLFERTNRRVALTQAGRMFLDEARATLAQADRAVQVARRAQRGELGELRIGMFPSAPLIPVVGRSILAFRRGYPDVQLTLSEFESRQQMQALAEGREHIAIVRGPASPNVPAELSASELLRERLVMVMPADHALARRPGKVAMAALADEPFVFYGSRMGTTLPTQGTGSMPLGRVRAADQPGGERERNHSGAGGGGVGNRDCSGGNVAVAAYCCGDAGNRRGGGDYVGVDVAATDGYVAVD